MPQITRVPVELVTPTPFTDNIEVSSYSGTITRGTDTITLPTAPNNKAQVMLFLSGVNQSDFIVTGNTIKLPEIVLEDLQYNVIVGAILTRPNSIGGNSIPLTGSRGKLAGYETVDVTNGSTTITIESADTTVIETSGSTTLTFIPSDANNSALKMLYLKAKANTILTISGAIWANKGGIPTWGNANTTLVLSVYFIDNKVIIGVFDNNQ